MHQVVLAITFLHKQGCVHRDLKPDNVLVKYERNNDNSSIATCKVTDFGFAKTFDQDTKMSLTLGTAPYMAPELLQKSKYDEKVDIWAIGVMTYYLIFQKLPFVGKDIPQVLQAIKTQKTKKDCPFGPYVMISKDAKNFIQICLRTDPNERPSAENLLFHPWMQRMLLNENS